MRFLFRTATLGFLTMGVVSLVNGGAMFTKAQLIGQGSLVLRTMMHKAAEATIAAAPMTDIVEPLRTSAETQLLFGMLLILVGFVIHAIYVLRHVKHLPTQHRTFLEGRRVRHAFVQTVV